jgi:lysosomal acid lipase/cholesteryl ester hydrolase
MFNIPANKSKEYLGSILIQHSDGDDGASWIENHDGAKPFLLKLADLGYNVWIGNSRGTEYSQRHKTYKATGISAKEYWDFSWVDMQKDVKANMEEILWLTHE